MNCNLFRTLVPAISMLVLAVCQAIADDTPANKSADSDAGSMPKGLVKLSKTNDVWLDTKRKAVVVDGQVCLREGRLEMFACSKGTKEHESIVAPNCQAQEVHAGLLAAGAKPGTPVSFNPEYKAATGQIVDVYVLWKDAAGEKHQALRSGLGPRHQNPKANDARLGVCRQWLLEGRRNRQAVLSRQRRRPHLCLQFSNRHARPARRKLTGQRRPDIRGLHEAHSPAAPRFASCSFRGRPTATRTSESRDVKCRMRSAQWPTSRDNNRLLPATKQRASRSSRSLRNRIVSFAMAGSSRFAASCSASAAIPFGKPAAREGGGKPRRRGQWRFTPRRPPPQSPANPRQ